MWFIKDAILKTLRIGRNHSGHLVTPTQLLTSFSSDWTAKKTIWVLFFLMTCIWAANSCLNFGKIKVLHPKCLSTLFQNSLRNSWNKIHRNSTYYILTLLVAITTSENLPKSLCLTMTNLLILAGANIWDVWVWESAGWVTLDLSCTLMGSSLLFVAVDHHLYRLLIFKLKRKSYTDCKILGESRWAKDA